MINKKVILFSVLCASVAGSAYATPKSFNEADAVIVNSKLRNQSVMAVGDKLQFSKTFDVIIMNGSAKPLNLSAGCFKAVMPDKTELPVDTIEKVLMKGTLKHGENLKGFVSFSSPDESVYNAQAVKFLPSCK
ncbi:DUF4354 family protein [Pseudochrobactrum sp. Wa41.01b-1]|uniref:DUF4354 family protein n=1 Tax=Pseudochrobactrum sp. Wa41.01b-1 TaxID=2864102 RepID=UPI001C68A258|nr:DUF4354 family protein [Pseudochrobactrum sp. Wa41.01b-1]QYM73837.1 DUF4354 family protein [Pseudochrobactrum sp. Wa41.01b-1]